MGKVTYVSIVKKALGENKTKEQILEILAAELPSMDSKKAASKLNATVKYLSTSKVKKEKTADTQES
jgi:hypothetical protein